MEGEPPVDPLASERILVADDDVVVRMLIEDLLQREHYAVSFAEDGKEALEMALQTLAGTDHLWTSRCPGWMA